MLIFKGDHIYIGYICLFLINIFCLFIWLTGIPYIVYRHFFLLTLKLQISCPNRGCVLTLIEVSSYRNLSFFIHTNRPCFSCDFCFRVFRICFSWQSHEHIQLALYNTMVLFIIKSTINLVYLHVLYNMFFSTPSPEESLLVPHESTYQFYNVSSFHIHVIRLH